MNRYTDDFFERIYDAEIEQKHRLDSADTFLVGIIGALIGVGAYLLQTLAKCHFGCAFYFLLLFGIPFFLALTASLCFIIASIWPRYKDYIASPQQWADYASEFEHYFSYYKIKEPELSDRVALEVSKLCRQQYIAAAETNRKLVVTKHAYQTKAKRCIVAAVVCMFLSAFPLFFIQAFEPTDSTANCCCCQQNSNSEISNNEQRPGAIDSADSTNPTDSTNTAKPFNAPYKTSTPNGQPDSGGRIESQKSPTLEEKPTDMSDTQKDSSTPEKPAAPATTGAPARPIAPGTIKVEASYPIGDKLPTNSPVAPMPVPKKQNSKEK